MYYMRLPKPPKNWFLLARCRGASAAEMPDEATGTANVREAGRNFIAKYCGDCPVRRECVVEVLGWPTEPLDCVRGGHMPMETSRLWLAARAIRGYEGGLRALVAERNISLVGERPDIPFAAPALDAQPSAQPAELPVAASATQ